MMIAILNYTVVLLIISTFSVSLTCSFQVTLHCNKNNNNIKYVAHQSRFCSNVNHNGFLQTTLSHPNIERRFSSTAINSDTGSDISSTGSPSEVVSLPESPSAVSSSTSPSAAVTPQFDGKRVLPYKIIMNGLKGNERKVATVYAIYNSNYQRGTDGWDTTTYVGVTQDIQSTLQTLYMNDVTELKVTHCRILSFTYPQPNVMQEVANQWRQSALAANAQLETNWADDVLNYMFDNDDDDDDDDDNDDMEMMGDAMSIASSSGGSNNMNVATTSTIISPFASTTADNDVTRKTDATTTTTTALLFTKENVDNVLNEVRPYLIADGGNVEVLSVDDVDQKVYLQLQGACGSCASSTITMQMGIERILREKFPMLTEVIKVDDNNDGKPKELSDYEAMVDNEIQRIRPAITAMGGMIQIRSVDHEVGIVQIEFRGSKKVQQGVELAILDIDFVKEVEFIDE